MSNCVTLYIQAHGGIITGQYISSDVSIHANILSFTGGLGRSSIMKRKCNYVRINPPEGVDIPVININGAQLDVMAVSYVQQVYTHISENTSIDENIKNQLAFDTVQRGISEVYTNCNVSRFPYSRNVDIKLHDAPFVTIPALQDKLYQLHPNIHEDCENPKECIRNNDLCDLLDKSKQICPYYGIYMVYSTNPEDIPHTLSGEQSRDGNDLIANLNTEEGHELGTTEYWENKIIRHWGNIITKEMTQTTIKRLEGERDRIIDLYRKMTLVLDPDIPTSQQIMMEQQLPKIKLSDLLEIFIKGMGYDNINIIDPSCDTCEYASPLKFTAHKFFRSIRSNTLSKRRSTSKRGGRRLTKKQKIIRRPKRKGKRTRRR